MFKIPGITKDSSADERKAAIAAHIATQSKADLDKGIADALAEARTLPQDNLSDDEVRIVEDLADFVTGARDAVATITAEETAKADRLSAARAALAEPVVEEPVAEADPDDPGEDDSGDEQIESDVVLEPIAASAVTEKKVPAVTRAAAATVVVDPAPKQRVREVATITAAADVPGVSLGSQIASIEDLSVPTHAVLESLGRATGATRIEKPIAVFNLARTDEFSATNDRDLQKMLTAIRDESRLPGGSLVAAGGWCAPSETVYGLCAGETTEGLWDLPSINVARGGLNFTKGPQFSDFYAGDSILQTEAQAIAGTAKTCVAITCPAFSEVRLDVMGFCVTVPILTEAAYPEVVDRWINGTLVAHQHRKSLNLINRALTIAGSAVAVANPWPTAPSSLLAALELLVNGERQRYRLGLNETLEAIFPFWIKAAIRADLSMRSGVDLINIPDSVIDSYFTTRGIRPQYLYGWQPLVPTSSGAGVAIDYPASLEVLVYPAGTFVQGTKDVITLTGVYDSVGLSTNVHTGIFTEEGISLMNMCYTPKRISLALSISGLTAAPIVNQDFGAAAPLVAAAAIPVL